MPGQTHGQVMLLGIYPKSADQHDSGHPLYQTRFFFSSSFFFLQNKSSRFFFPSKMWTEKTQGIWLMNHDKHME